ncbi:hypothetical protein DH2020_044661 [Rehmannia glutinosa]|uniref:PIG-P domain-containing protein n=1 Tax=Rehmannia glutinosa TaxID=99300 RepID=A0ABR0UH12_REHGL
MEEHSSVNSRRRILSFSKDRTTDVSFSCRTRFRVSRQNGAKTSEVYGFVGFITTLAATVCAWYWALSVPTHVMVTIVLAIGLYIGLNFMATPPPTSLKSMFDEYSKEPLSSIPATNDDEQAIEPISDIGTNQVNGMFNNLKWEPC